MNKYNILKQINIDIEILENSNNLKSASILHKKFLRIANVDPTQPSPDMVPPSNYPYNQKAVPPMPSGNSQSPGNFSIASIERVLSGNNPQKFDQAQRIFGEMMKTYPMPKNDDPKDIARWEKITGDLTSQYYDLVRKYKHNLRPDLMGTMHNIEAKSIPEQAKNSADLQAKWSAIWNSKKPRMQKYRELLVIHQNAEKMWEQGKISRAGVQTFRDMMVKTEMLNYPYPIPGDPGFKPQII